MTFFRNIDRVLKCEVTNIWFAIKMIKQSYQFDKFNKIGYNDDFSEFALAIAVTSRQIDEWKIS